MFEMLGVKIQLAEETYLVICAKISMSSFDVGAEPELAFNDA